MNVPVGSEATRRSRGASLGCGRQAAVGTTKAQLTERPFSALPPRSPAPCTRRLLSLGRAAKEFRVSDTTIKRLVAGGLLTVVQLAPWAAWEIRRVDLQAEPVRSVLEHLRRTGELVLPGDTSTAQPPLFQ